ncbi:hypothetical protein Mgra_00004616, partial [Meloidogyne graminicola]
IGPNAEFYFWWVKPNNKEELLLSSFQSRQSVTNDPFLSKSKSDKENRLSNQIPIFDKSPSSRIPTTSIWFKEDKTTRPSSFTNLNNSKIYNGEIPRISSFNESLEINNNNNLGIRKWS